MTRLVTDDELLGALAVALAPAPAEPSELSILRLRGAALGLTFGQTDPRPRRVGRRVAIPAAVAFTVLGSAGAVAAATGAPLPRPVRAAAYGIGLPVDSPAVADVRATETRVRRDLAGADHSQLAGEVETLRTRLAHVEDDKRVRVQREAQPLIEKANRVLERDKEPQGGGRGPAARQSQG